MEKLISYFDKESGYWVRVKCDEKQANLKTRIFDAENTEYILTTQNEAETPDDHRIRHEDILARYRRGLR